MGSEQQRQGGGATVASPPAVLMRSAAGDAPPAAMTAKHDRESGGAEQAPPSSVDDRLLRATIDVVATVGYAATQAADIVRASGLSRTVFYRHLGGKRRATLTAARRILDDLDRTVQTALAAHDERGGPGSTRALPGARRAGDAARPGGPARVAVGLQALTDALAADPPAAAVLFLEAPAAGPDAQDLRDDLVALLNRILGDPPGLPGWSPAGAVLHVLHRRVADGEISRLPGLVPELVHGLGRHAP